MSYRMQFTLRRALMESLYELGHYRACGVVLMDILDLARSHLDEGTGGCSDELSAAAMEFIMEATRDLDGTESQRIWYASEKEFLTLFSADKRPFDLDVHA